MPALESPTVRVILRWLQIRDDHEPFFKGHGEFFFRARVTSDGRTVEHRIPREGQWQISDRPGFNRIDSIDLVLFEGPVDETMVVEFSGIEVDRFTDDDRLERYRREFTGNPASWAGLVGPHDEGGADPENLGDWRIGYEIQVGRSAKMPRTAASGASSTSSSTAARTMSGAPRTSA